jgi:predicted nucleotidyltransferase
MMNLEEVIKISGHSADNVLGVYQYGSRVYGTFSDRSDYDFIMIVDELDRDGNACGSDQVEQNNLSLNIYEKAHFNELLQRHSIQALEVLFLDQKFILQNSILFPFKLNKEELRKSLSEKSDNSWVKAKKKFMVEKDYDPYIAKKSLFHSLRILNFGIQIAKNAKIIDYQAANHYWTELNDNSSQNWNDYNELYKQEYNRLKSEFRLLAPLAKDV